MNPLLLAVLLGMGAVTVAGVASSPKLDANLPKRYAQAVGVALTTTDPGKSTPARLLAFSDALRVRGYPLAAAAVAARAKKG